LWLLLRLVLKLVPFFFVNHGRQQRRDRAREAAKDREREGAGER